MSIVNPGFNPCKALDEIILTGRKVTIEVLDHPVSTDVTRYEVSVDKPEVFAFSDISLAKAIERAYRMVFR